jgi:hypothetical protein
VFRDDYLDGLRGLSRRNDPSVYIKAMRYAHSFTASVDFSDYDAAKAQLEEANAFEEPDSPNRLRTLERVQSSSRPAREMARARPSSSAFDPADRLPPERPVHERSRDPSL